MADSSSNSSVQLGCGTLILIAIIVAVFSNLGLKGDVDERFQRMERQLDAIESRLDAISGSLGVPPASQADAPASPGPDTPVEAPDSAPDTEAGSADD